MIFYREFTIINREFTNELIPFCEFTTNFEFNIANFENFADLGTAKFYPF